MECEQLALFDAQLKLGDKVKVNWNEADVEYIKKSLPHLLTTGIVKRERLGSYDVSFGDYTSYLVDKNLLVKL